MRNKKWRKRKEGGKNERDSKDEWNEIYVIIRWRRIIRINKEYLKL